MNAKNCARACSTVQPCKSNRASMGISPRRSNFNCLGETPEIWYRSVLSAVSGYSAGSLRLKLEEGMCSELQSNWVEWGFAVLFCVETRSRFEVLKGVTPRMARSKSAFSSSQSVSKGFFVEEVGFFGVTFVKMRGLHELA